MAASTPELYLILLGFVQVPTYLKDIVGLIPNHHNKASPYFFLLLVGLAFNL